VENSHPFWQFKISFRCIVIHKNDISVRRKIAVNKFFNKLKITFESFFSLIENFLVKFFS